jgi:hypothetical protein
MATLKYEFFKDKSAQQWALELNTTLATVYNHYHKHGSLDVLVNIINSGQIHNCAGRKPTYFEDRSYDEWCTLLNVPKSTLRYHIRHYNSLDKLRERV